VELQAAKHPGMSRLVLKCPAGAAELRD
jgi:hypothetical protein